MSFLLSVKNDRLYAQGGSDAVIEHVLTNVGIHSTQRIVQKVNVPNFKKITFYEIRSKINQS